MNSIAAKTPVRIGFQVVDQIGDRIWNMIGNPLWYRIEDQLERRIRAHVGNKVEFPVLVQTRSVRDMIVAQYAGIES